MFVGLFITTPTDRPDSYKAARHRSKKICRLQLKHKATTVTDVNPHVAGAINISRDQI